VQLAVPNRVHGVDVWLAVTEGGLGPGRCLTPGTCLDIQGAPTVYGPVPVAHGLATFRVAVPASAADTWYLQAGARAGGVAQLSQPATVDVVDPPASCNAATAGQAVPRTLVHDGETRSFVLYLPADYDCSPRPVLMGLHGYYGSGSGFLSAELQADLDREGVIGVFPDGLAMGTGLLTRWVTSFNDLDTRNDTGPDGPTCTTGAYDYGTYTNCPTSEAQRTCHWGTSCADDEGFFRALLADLASRHAVDPRRQYLTGFSQGGQTTQSIGRRMSDVFAAIAPMHGFSANGYTQGPATPQALVQVWGRSDRTVDGNDQPSDDGMIYDGGAETAAVWATELACTAGPSRYRTVSDGIQGWRCEAYTGCAGGVEVIDCSWNGAHVWPTSLSNPGFGWRATWPMLMRHAKP
jgi:polyhydroxybutyrate depolymerase